MDNTAAPGRLKVRLPVQPTPAKPVTEAEGKGVAVRRTGGLMTTQLSKAWIYGALAMLAVGAFFRNSVLFSVGLLLAVALGVAWTWARYSLEALTLERRFSQTRAFFGEEIDMTHVLTNTKPLPIPWLALDDEFPSALQIDSPAVAHSHKIKRKGLHTAVSLGWYEWVIRHYKVKCLARGEHEFGPIEMQSGDIFGLFRRIEQLDTPQTLLVYPRYVPVERLGIPAAQPFGDFKAIKPLATDPLRFRAIREYIQGDNPRHIHWRATARQGELQTKLFEPAATPQLFIFCNQDTFAHIREGLDLDTLELTITVAASLANHALEEGYMVGLQVNSLAARLDRQVKIQPSRDLGQFTRILENLARVTGWSGLPMEDLLRSERHSLPIGATIIVVTGVVTGDMLDTLLSLRRASYPVTLVETAGSLRAAEWASYVSSDVLWSQGINYYLVEALKGPLEVLRTED